MFTMKPFKIFIIFTLLISFSLSGCIESECNYLGTRIYIEYTAEIHLHIAPIEDHLFNEYLRTNFTFYIQFDSEHIKSWSFIIMAHDEEQGDIHFQPKISEQESFKGYYKYPNNLWSNISFRLCLISDNSTINEKTFFNDSNIISGKLRTNGEARGREVELDFSNDGNEFVRIMEKQSTLILEIMNNEWYIPIKIFNKIACT